MRRWPTPLLLLPLLLPLLAACAGSPPAATAQASPSAPAPKPGAQRLSGRYSYFAEVGWFSDCASGERLWVVPEADNRALEAAALAARKQPGDTVLATVDGRRTVRVNMEGPARPALIVDRFVAVEAGADCPAGAAPSLERTRWKPVELRGMRVEQTTAELQLLGGEGSRYAGSGGCNRIGGSYQLEGSRLRFGRGMSTMMACPEGMELEQRFTELLQAVQAWRIEGGQLLLLDDTGLVIARFARSEAR